MQLELNKAYQSYDKKMISMIHGVTESYILHLIKNNTNKQKIEEIINCLKIMLNGNYEKYKFNENVFYKITDNTLGENEVQEVLSKLNEKQSVRKSNGVYYTPKDVVSFIIDNCFNRRVQDNINIICKLNNSDMLYSFIYNDTILDPTCGTGEFLLGAFLRKIELIKNEIIEINDRKISDILETIYGNDINIESIEITKIRLFFETIKHAKSIESYQNFARIINSNMSCSDFVNAKITNFKRYDIIIGNPPYVEERKSSIKPLNRYGNIYANILQNSVDLLKDSGVLGFIIPISYIATPRMKKIRNYIKEHTAYQIVLNYADRPDCLFVSVHQKLSIIFAKQGNEKHCLYTSGYKYWYKNERKQLFENISINKNKYIYDEFYPKIGNTLENAIFEKVFTQDNNNILQQNKNKEPNVFLNMRGCFWIKAFSFNPGSKEYKGFTFDDNIKDFISCLLNSSLFFLFWTMISDCWHITSKELRYFMIPDLIPSQNKFKNLFKKLESKLDKTKKYIGTKQTEYEYKHKLCKDIIDEIDDELAKVYKLTDSELDYVKSYSSKYRESLGDKK